MTNGEVAILIIDCGILFWLVFTWFYEGHHKRCAVEVECPSCKRRDTHACSNVK